MTVFVLAALAPRCEARHATRQFPRVRGSEIHRAPFRISRKHLASCGPQMVRPAPILDAYFVSPARKRFRSSNRAAARPIPVETSGVSLAV